MRTTLISIAAAASALAVATPAAAQYYPAPPPPAYGYGYGQQAPYGNYGYQNQWRVVRALQARVDRLQGRLDRLAQRRIITRGEYRRLHGNSHRIEQQLRAASRYGLNRRERYDIEVRIARLEQRIAHEARDGRWNRDYHDDGDYHGNGNRRVHSDRDRDGRDDRYEDDRGHDHDD